MSKGTKNSRAPEQTTGKQLNNLEAVDVYSIGICLFVLYMGYLPYQEDERILGKDLWKLLLSNPAGFWATHEEICGG